MCRHRVFSHRIGIVQAPIHASNQNLRQNGEQLSVSAHMVSRAFDVYDREDAMLNEYRHRNRVSEWFAQQRDSIIAARRVDPNRGLPR